MILQKPKDKNWPDFFGERVSQRDQIEREQSVKDLIGSRLLLTKNLNKLLGEVIILTNNNKNILTSNFVPPRDELKKRILEIVKTQHWEQKPTEEERDVALDAAIEEAFQKASAELEYGDNLKRKKEIIDNSTSIEEQVSAFSETHSVHLGICKNVALYYCKKCNKFLYKDEFKTIKCKCGIQVSRVSDTEKIPIVEVDDAVGIFFGQNMWLEYGVEMLFRQEGFETKSGVYLLGDSGVSHEIDLVAEKPSTYTRVIGECKNQEITIAEIFKLYGKMKDLGISVGFIFSTGSYTNLDVIKLARSKNIIVVDTVLEKTETEIKEKIKKID